MFDGKDGFWEDWEEGKEFFGDWTDHLGEWVGDAEGEAIGDFGGETGGEDWGLLGEAMGEAFGEILEEVWGFSGSTGIKHGVCIEAWDSSYSDWDKSAITFLLDLDFLVFLEFFFVLWIGFETWFLEFFSLFFNLSLRIRNKN